MQVKDLPRSLNLIINDDEINKILSDIGTPVSNYYRCLFVKVEGQQYAAVYGIRDTLPYEDCEVHPLKELKK
jgi:hypothetical protein